MTRIGCLVASLGLMLIAGSVFLFGAAISGVAHGSPEGLVQPIAPESLEPIVVSGLPANGHRRLACRLQVTSDSMREQPRATIAEARFRFPLAYVIRATDGRVLAQGDGVVAWDARDRRTVAGDSAAPGAPLIVEQPFATCTVPADGALSVTLLLRSDDTFRAIPRQAWLVVHDDDARSGSLALIGALLLVVGPLLAATGLGMVVMSWMGRKKSTTKATAGG